MCSRARLYGWRGSVNLQHSEMCRQIIESELATTVKGQARLELSKTRLDRRRAAAVAEDPQVAHDKEEEKAAAAAIVSVLKIHITVLVELHRQRGPEYSQTARPVRS